MFATSCRLPKLVAVAKVPALIAAIELVSRLSKPTAALMAFLSRPTVVP